VAERSLIGVFHEDTSGLAIGKLPCAVASCLGSGLCGEGETPLPCPHPLGDSHHGPLPGLARGIGRVPACSPSHCPWTLHTPRVLPRDPHQNPQTKIKWSTTPTPCWHGQIRAPRC